MTKAKSIIVNFALIVFGVVGFMLALAGFSIGICMVGRLFTYTLVCLQAAVGGLVMGLIMFGSIGMVSIVAVVVICTSK